MKLKRKDGVIVDARINKVGINDLPQVEAHYQLQITEPTKFKNIEEIKASYNGTLIDYQDYQIVSATDKERKLLKLAGINMLDCK